jgi:hypothetical protein
METPRRPSAGDSLRALYSLEKLTQVASYLGLREKAVQ